MAAQNWKALLQGLNNLESEAGFVQISGTTTTAEIPVNKLKWILGYSIAPAPGTAGITNPETFYLSEAAQGTAGTGPAADFHGAIQVTGTSVTLTRFVDNLTGTVVGTGVTDLWVMYDLKGVSK